MLRVTDVLTKNLITAAIQHDMQMTTTRQANYDILSGEMINHLLTTIRSCGVTFAVRPGKTVTAFEFTSLMGKEKVKLLQNLPEKLSGCQPDEFSSVVQKIWKVAIASYSHARMHMHVCSLTDFILYYYNRILLSCIKYSSHNVHNHL